MNCARCQDIRWICEEHPDKPMEHDGCKGSGMPCPDCNPSSRGKVPVLPPDLEIDRVVAVADADNEHDEAAS